MADVHIEVDATNTDGYLRSYSHFDKKEGKRLIEKNKVSGRKVAENIAESKGTAIKQIAASTILIDNDEDRYEVLEPSGSYISLPISFYKKLIKLFPTNVNNVYCWLYRRFKFAKSRGRKCLFSKGQICTEALKISNQSKNRKNVEDILNTLAWNGLISYRIIKYNNTYLRELTGIREEFSIIEQTAKMLEQLTDGDKEFSGNIDDVREEELKVIATIGFKDEIMQQLSANGMSLRELLDLAASDDYLSLGESTIKEF